MLFTVLVVGASLCAHAPLSAQSSGSELGPPSSCLATEEALAFWQPVRERAAEEPLPANELALPLTSCLGSPNPELRDRIGYELLTYWLRSDQVADETRRALLAELSQKLHDSAEEASLARSFSALILSEVMRSDAQSPFMTEGERARLLDDARRALERESDYRGLVPEIGWVHPVAHLADVLWRVALHPHSGAVEARVILDALARKAAPSETAYAFNESDRMARVVVVIVRRSLLDTTELTEWLDEFETPRSMDAWTDAFRSPEGMRQLHNAKLFLRALSDQLAGAEIDVELRERIDALVAAFTEIV